MTHVLMLGWEYPPHISGGLGTACEGITRGLARQNVDITFIIPSLGGGEDASHMTLLDPSTVVTTHKRAVVGGIETSEEVDILESIRSISIPAFLKPYWSESAYVEALKSKNINQNSHLSEYFELSSEIIESTGTGQYGKSLLDEVARYTTKVLTSCSHLSFDVIHAHDWMTIPAGVALSEVTGKPLIVHIHSLEYDRSGKGKNPQIDSIERLGTSHADLVIAVSHYTKSLIAKEHGVSEEKISVVHNGIYPSAARAHYEAQKEKDEKTVLFLGRITFQKGPDYLVEAAAQVIPELPHVRFIIAGSGDMLPQLQNRVSELGIQDKIDFPGFLRGTAVEEAFINADLYVMPSVSEPFGISALEAISFDTPALISRQSGVSEVIDHSLKFDFWDTDRLADLILNALEFGELREDMISSARRELSKLRWDASAGHIKEIYHSLV